MLILIALRYYSENSQKRQLLLSSKNIQDVEHLKYRLGGPTTKKPGPQDAVELLQEHLLSVQSDV